MRIVGPSLSGSIVLLAACVSSSPSRVWTSVDNVPAAVVNGSSDSITTSVAYGFDSPKIRPVNSSSWDWWYFDVVSEDAQSSAVVVFYTAPETGFVFAEAPTDSILEASLSVILPGSDGHPETISVVNFAEKATIVTVENGASGEWTGSGFSFAGTPDMKEYIVTINDEMSGVKGTITYHSVCCSPRIYAFQNHSKSDSSAGGTGSLPMRVCRSWTTSGDPSNNRVGKFSPRCACQRGPHYQWYKREVLRRGLPRQ